MVNRQLKDAFGKEVCCQWINDTCKKLQCFYSHDKIANKKCWQKNKHDHQKCKYLHSELPAAAGEQEGNKNPDPFSAVIKLPHGREEMWNLPRSSSSEDTLGPWSPPKYLKKHKSTLQVRPLTPPIPNSSNNPRHLTSCAPSPKQTLDEARK